MQNTFKIGDTVRFTEQARIDKLSSLDDKLLGNNYDYCNKLCKTKWIISDHKIISVSSFGGVKFYNIDGQPDNIVNIDTAVQSHELELVSRAETPTEEVKKETEPLYEVGDVVCFTEEMKRISIVRDTDSNFYKRNHTIYDIRRDIYAQDNYIHHYQFEDCMYWYNPCELQLVHKVEEEQTKQAPDMKVLTIGDKFQLTDKAYRKCCSKMISIYSVLDNLCIDNSYISEYFNKFYLLGLKNILSFNRTFTVASWYSDEGGSIIYVDQNGVKYPESSIVKVEE